MKCTFREYLYITYEPITMTKQSIASNVCGSSSLLAKKKSFSRSFEPSLSGASLHKTKPLWQNLAYMSFYSCCGRCSFKQALFFQFYDVASIDKHPTKGFNINKWQLMLNLSNQEIRGNKLPLIKKSIRIRQFHPPPPAPNWESLANFPWNLGQKSFGDKFFFYHQVAQICHNENH